MFSGVASLRTAYSKPVNPLGYVEVKRLHSNPAAALSDPNTCATNSYRSRCVESRQFRRSNDLSSYGFHRNTPKFGSVSTKKSLTSSRPFQAFGGLRCVWTYGLLRCYAFLSVVSDRIHV